MICVLWRQHRTHLMWAAVVLAAYGVFMLLVGHSAHAWLANYHKWLAQLQSAGCPLPTGDSDVVHVPSNATCQALLTRYPDGAQGSFGAAYNFAVPVFEEGIPLAMVFIAVLIGAPLVAREVEQRTHIVSWTQSVSRRRWYTTKTATLGLGIAFIGLIGGIANDRLQIPLTAGGLTSSRWPWFFSIDLSPAAEALVAFAVAVALGAWLRRTLLTIGAALVSFLAIFLLTGWVVRSLTPLSRGNGPRSIPDNSWLIGNGAYHPASQYWPLQLTYVAILVVIAGSLLVVGWRVSRPHASI